MPTQQLLDGACAVAYLVLPAFIAVRSRHRTGWLLVACCLATAAWAAANALPLDGWPVLPDALDHLRSLSWYGFVLHLYGRFVPSGRAWRVFAAAGAVAVLAAVAAVAEGRYGVARPSILSLGIMVRLGIAVCELLLIENLYLNLPDHSRWHVALPCVLLGGLACFDIMLCADLVLFQQASASLAGAHAIAIIIVAPPLLAAAARDRRWRPGLQLSHTAVFHSATLILSGAVLLALSAAGEVFRQFGAGWGWMAEASMAFAALIGIGLLLTSGSARSRLRRTVVEHFFARRYDYRQQWLDCIDTLSATKSQGRAALHTRVIRALADVVDSPNGALFLRDGGAGAFQWSGSWNMPAASPVPPGHSLVAAMSGGQWIAMLDGSDGVGAGAREPPLDQLGRLWLSIPLVDGDQQIGLVLVGPPRAPFELDQEVFDLLRIVGREAASFVAEQRATRVLLQTRQLHDYGKRFAFVAHDIKNVSSQLSLLLSNAERHIANPEFQRDMLETVGASVQKIAALLRRLDAPATDRAPAALAPVPRLEALLATYRRARRTALPLEHDGSTATVAISPDAFDTAVTHLLNNAIEASGSRPVRLRVRHEAQQVVIDIIDYGCGMTSEFIRDQLFQPFGTSKRRGSGIGAFQARELLREGGGDVQAISAPGAGTTMRLALPRADTACHAAPAAAPPKARADAQGFALIEGAGP